MADLNKVILTGTVFRPKYQEFDSGKKKLTFSLSIDDSYKPKDGDWVTRNANRNVEVWGDMAERNKDLYEKCNVLIEGKLKTSQYEKDGEKKYFDYIEPLKLEFFYDRKGLSRLFKEANKIQEDKHQKNGDLTVTPEDMGLKTVKAEVVEDNSGLDLSKLEQNSGEDLPF